MDEILSYLQVKRNLINLLLLAILVLAIPIGIQILHSQQIAKSQAAAPPIELVQDKCLVQKNGAYFSKCPQINIKLTSPLGGPTP